MIQRAMLRRVVSAVVLGLVFCIAEAHLAPAEVVDSSAGGFTVKVMLNIQGGPGKNLGEKSPGETQK